MRDIFAWLLLLVPASLLSALLTSPHSTPTFIVSTLAVIPLAEWIRRVIRQRLNVYDISRSIQTESLDLLLLARF